MSRRKKAHLSIVDLKGAGISKKSSGKGGDFTILEIPDALQVIAPTSGQGDKWFSFWDKKYLTVGLVDADDSPVRDESIELQMTLSTKEKPSLSYRTDSVGLYRGAYWFKFPRPNFLGTLRLEIHGVGDSSIAKIHREIDCAPSNGYEPSLKLREGTPKAQGKGANDMDSAGAAGGRAGAGSGSGSSSIASQKRSRHQRGDAESEEDSVASKSSRSTTASRSSRSSRSSRILEKEKPAPAETKKRLVSISEVVGTKKLPSRSPQSLPPLPEEMPVLPYPSIINLKSVSISSRILRQVGDDDQKNIQLSKCVPSIALPRSLVVALLDDQARVNTYRIQELAKETSRKSSKSKSPRSKCAPPFISSPSAQDLLQSVAQRCKQIDAGHLLKLMGWAFELYFEQFILYAEEKQWYKAYLSAITRQKEPFAAHFGPIYLLRLVVVLVNGMNRLSTEESGGSDPSDAATAVTKGVVSAVAGAGAGARDKASASASSKEAETTALRNSKAAVRIMDAAKQKLVDMLKFITAELDEASHFLF
jgi:hypothetical protein